MKKAVSLLLTLIITLSLASCSRNASPVSVSDDEFSKSAKEICSDMVAGWNLGNTLDSCKLWGEISDNPTPGEQETGWNNPETTKEIIDKVVDSGFNTIRIPVTWDLQIENQEGRYIVKEEWLNRVQEVVDYSITAGAYTIINIHHDDATWLNISAPDDEWKTIKNKYKQVWKQIAQRFKKYGEKLIFEGANEMTATTLYDGCGEDNNAKCWWGHNQTAFDRINDLYDIFVNTVRKSGGNNDKRYLMLPTYGAQWYDNQINKLEIPNNDKHIIMDVHWYKADINNKEANRGVFSVMRKFADDNGIGAVIGESGLSAESTDEQKKAFADNVVGCAKEYGIPVFLWDDGGNFKILDRSALTWNSEAYVSEVVKVSKETKTVY